MATVELEDTEIKALIQIIEATSIRGCDSRLVSNILDKLEATKDSDD